MAGRHLQTLNTLTAATLFSFGYDSAGRITSITDGDGNVTTVERNSNGDRTAIVAPFGQRTTPSLDSNGYLASITDPAGDANQYSYSPDRTDAIGSRRCRAGKCGNTRFFA